jgi:hypothetical protein
MADPLVVLGVDMGGHGVALLIVKGAPLVIVVIGGRRRTLYADWGGSARGDVSVAHATFGTSALCGWSVRWSWVRSLFLIVLLGK